MWHKLVIVTRYVHTVLGGVWLNVLVNIVDFSYNLTENASVFG